MILLSIEGMTCPSCVAHVKEALDAIEGVNNVEVSYENASATIDQELHRFRQSLQRKYVVWQARG